MKDLRSITSASNGALSNGTATPEGKRRSSRNAEKHGIYSSAVLLQNESAESLEALRAGYDRRLQPANQPESDLVDQMVAAAWRIRRFTAVETAAIDHPHPPRHRATHFGLPIAPNLLPLSGRPDPHHGPCPPQPPLPPQFLPRN